MKEVNKTVATISAIEICWNLISTGGSKLVLKGHLPFWLFFINNLGGHSKQVVLYLKFNNLVIGQGNTTINSIIQQLVLKHIAIH